MILATIINCVLALVSIIADKLFPQPHHRVKIASFAAGTAVSYLFLQFLPEMIEGYQYAGNFVFVSILFGFSAHYLAEQIIYQHSPKKKILQYAHDLHITSFTAYHAIIGIIVWKLATISSVKAIMFAITIGFVLFMTTRIISELDLKLKKETKLHEACLAAAFPIGGIAAYLLNLPRDLFLLCLASWAAL